MVDQTSWTELNFIERESIPIMAPGALELENVKWFEFTVTDEGLKWVQEINEVVMEFGGVFHSIFLRWAVTINGLHVAADKYSDPEWKKKGWVSPFKESEIVRMVQAPSLQMYGYGMEVWRLKYIQALFQCWQRGHFAICTRV